jgi:hypothetical protein
MADLELTPVTTGPRTASAPLTLRAAAILTTDPVDSDTVAVIGWDFAVFRVVFTIGSLTECLLRVYGYDGTNWTQLGYKGTIGAVDAGHTNLTPDTMCMKATMTIALPPISCLGFQKLKVSAEGDGGTVTDSSLAITVTGGCYTGNRA